ncbi:MAG TPA: Kazal-type serine protease inhibitor domain-containing protein [Polyangiaceae bacterium]|nr:Kazal-type serine protease inhibitor domain-containing protein [Polyangiaceae bacterium]
MRDALFSLGFVMVSACSLDHVVVATLEDSSAGASSAGAAGSAMAGRAGSAGAPPSASSAGMPAAVGATAESSAGSVSSASGGSIERGMLPSLGGAGGAGTALLCSCLEQRVEVCGSDGVTYPNECSDAGLCFPPAIACWHACPCLDAELAAGAGGTTATRWFSSDCVSDNPCTGDVVCMMFSNVDRDAQTLCMTAN